ncbi:MAG: DnaB-like helicase C-terminal domain-containing protein [Pseudomonadota bacterium]
MLSRDKGIRLHTALNQIATKEGLRDWSHLAFNYSKTTPAKEIINQLNSGDMVLIGARPGRGKTLLGLELAGMAKQNSRKGYVFSLDYNDTDVWDRFKKTWFRSKGT